MGGDCKMMRTIVGLVLLLAAVVAAPVAVADDCRVVLYHPNTPDPFVSDCQHDDYYEDPQDGWCTSYSNGYDIDGKYLEVQEGYSCNNGANGSCYANTVYYETGPVKAGLC
jgi:hypothetical protein